MSVDQKLVTIGVARVEALAKEQEELTANDVWPALPEIPKEERKGLMSAIFRTAKLRGDVELTAYTRKSTRRVNHGRSERVWRSRIFNGRPTHWIALGGTDVERLQRREEELARALETALRYLRAGEVAPAEVLEYASNVLRFPT